MAEEKNVNERVLEKLKDLEGKLEIQKKEALIGNEDQLFFGVIISFFILFVTLPTNDLAKFLQSVFGIQESFAQTSAANIRYWGIIIFLVSGLTRYAAVISNESRSKILRYISFEAFWFALNVTILLTAINLFTVLSSKIGVEGLTITFWILTVAFIAMLILEISILKLYSRKEFVPKAHSFPYVSEMMLLVIFSLSLALVVDISAAALGFGLLPTNEFFLTYVIVAFTTSFLFLFWLPRRKKRRELIVHDIRYDHFLAKI
jgi:hypothetical protein